MFNSLKYSKELEEAGFSREQAEATIGVFFKFMEYNFATKTDIGGMDLAIQKQIDLLKGDLQSQINSVKEDLQSQINSVRIDLNNLSSKMIHGFESMEQKMTIKFGLMQVGAVALLTAILKLF